MRPARRAVARPSARYGNPHPPWVAGCLAKARAFSRTRGPVCVRGHARGSAPARLLFQLGDERVDLLILQASRRRRARWTAGGTPAVVGLQDPDDLLAAPALLDQTCETSSHRLEIGLELHHIGL